MQNYQEMKQRNIYKDMGASTYIYAKKFRCDWVYKISYVEIILGLILNVLWPLLKKKEMARNC